MEKLIASIVPFIQEEFITCPLWEEGNYNLCVNIWKLYKSQEEFDIMLKKLNIPDDIDLDYEITEIEDFKPVITESSLSYESLNTSHLRVNFSISNKLEDATKTNPNFDLTLPLMVARKIVHF